MTTRTLTALTILVLASSASAKTHFNSKTKLITDGASSPVQKNIFLADIDGDGLKDYVGYSQDATGFDLSAARADMTWSSAQGWHYPLIARFDSHADPQFWTPSGALHIDRIFSGYFDTTGRESICFRTRVGPGGYGQEAIYCFLYNGTNFVITSSYVEPVGLFQSREFLVGDFDGDGYDELVTYSLYDGSGLKMYEYNQTIGWATYAGFTQKRDFDAANVAGYSAPGTTFFAANVADQSGEGRRDDLVAVSGAGVVTIFHARSSGGNTVFWARANTGSGFLSSDEEPTVADADGDGYEDLVLHDRSYGNNRFISLLDWSLFTTMSFRRPEQGQLPTYASATENHVHWGLLKAVAGEGGNTNKRDDAVVVVPGTNTYSRFDARWCVGSSWTCPSYGTQTYWYYASWPVGMLRANLGLAYYGS